MASRERTEGARYLAEGFSFSILGQFRPKLRYENRLRLARKLSTLRSRKTLGSFVGVAYRFDNSTSVVDQLESIWLRQTHVSAWALGIPWIAPIAGEFSPVLECIDSDDLSSSLATFWRKSHRKVARATSYPLTESCSSLEK